MCERRRLCITKRACIALVLFVLAGAIVNVAVAWGLTQWAHPYTSRILRSRLVSQVLQPDPFGQFTGREHRVEYYRAFGGISIHCQPGALISEADFKRSLQSGVRAGRMVERLDLPSWSSVTSIEADGTLRSREDAIGWPMLSQRCFYEDITHLRNAAVLPIVQDGIALPPLVLSNGSVMALGLPTRPIWPGFAINTVFYAFVLWLLFALGGTPFALRRRRRIKRGLCPKCAYPVGTNAVCTECGAAVVKQKAETQKAEIA